jgi:hypothetical protein
VHQNMKCRAGQMGEEEDGAHTWGVINYERLMCHGIHFVLWACATFVRHGLLLCS